MTSLYDSIAATESGSRALAAARLRYNVLAVLDDARARSGLSPAALAGRLGVDAASVHRVLAGHDHLDISTFAEYLHVLGFEVGDLVIMPSGWQRKRAVQQERTRGRADEKVTP